MNVWIWPVTRQNWPSVQEHKVWAVDTKAKGKDVQKGDKIIFYVKQTFCFGGIYEVKTDWHKPKFNWPNDNVDRNYMAEIDLVEIQLGCADARKLSSKLAFLKNKSGSLLGLALRGSPAGPANNAQPITDQDYTIILNELKLTQNNKALDVDDNRIKTSKTTKTKKPLVSLSSESFETIKIPAPDKTTPEMIFQDVEKGRCAVPDFQRYWTWTKKQIEELWESIFQGYYIGPLLIWPSSTVQLGKRKIMGSSTFDTNPYLILDGQQRITAIYYAVKAPDISVPNTERPYKFFLNINALLDSKSDPSEIIFSENTQAIKNKNYDDRNTQYEMKIFPLTLFQNKQYSDWLFGFYNYLKTTEQYKDKDAQKYHKKLHDIFSNVWSLYEIPVVKLPDTLSLDNVATVFERINSKGTILNTFDLLNARFTIHNIALHDKWENIKNQHDHIRKWYEDFKNTKIPLYIIQALSLSKSGSMRRKDLLHLDNLYTNLESFDSDTFSKDWNEMSKYVEQAIIRITSNNSGGFGAITYDFIPYTIMVPVLASLLKEIETKSNRASCLNKISFWYWNSIQTDRYSAATDSATESDFRRMKEWFDNDTNPFFIIARDSFNTQKNTSALYKAIMCIIAKNGALDFISSDSLEYGNVEDHHIFPRSKAKDLHAENDIDSILNRTLISDKTNKLFANKTPSEYLTGIIKHQNIDKNELQYRLSTHLISPKAFEYLLKDDFKGFIKEREQTILDEFEKLLSFEYCDPSFNIELLDGENQHVEYKQTLRWDTLKNKVNTILEETVMKALACFMNASGGHLLIGINDSGTPTGLKSDYKSLPKQNSGGFQEHLTDLINKYLGKNANSYADWTFHQIGGVEICVGTITRSTKPIYVKINNEKKFYVRHNNTCQPYDVEEALDYISNRN